MADRAIKGSSRLSPTSPYDVPICRSVDITKSSPLPLPSDAGHYDVLKCQNGNVTKSSPPQLPVGASPYNVPMCQSGNRTKSSHLLSPSDARAYDVPICQNLDITKSSPLHLPVGACPYDVPMCQSGKTSPLHLPAKSGKSSPLHLPVGASAYDVPVCRSTPLHLPSEAMILDVNKSPSHSRPGAKTHSRDRSCWFLLCLLVLIGTVAGASLAVAVWSVAMVNTMHGSCVSKTEVQDSISELNDTFTGFVKSSVLNRIELLNISSANSVELLQEQINEVTQIFVGQDSSYPANSCHSVFPFIDSGHYWVRSSNGSAVRVYCDMTRSCGGVTGGWMRVASLNFSTNSVSCPKGLQERNDANISTCGIRLSTAGCASVLFGTSPVAYTQVSGKVLAYQIGNTDAFGDFGRGENASIDSNYVDGITLTHGSNPRQHIWTFAAAVDEYGGRDHEAICECSHSGRRGEPSPPFVGQDYFCDSGTRKFTSSDGGRFFGDSPLWDGAGCGPDSTCCSFNNPPWFHKQLPSPTSDAIEMRVCRDEARSNEDIAVSSVEIYVR